jgi:sulfotransferase
MDKTFFFMAGLPRSGSTLLSSILNQNPDIYVSPQNDLPRMMFALYQEMQVSEPYWSGFNPQGFENLMRRVPDNFYENVDKKYIIDKNRAWGTPDNLQLANLITKDVKIIAPVRPILEILASFIRLAEKNPNNFIDRMVGSYPASQYRPLNDARCDALMAGDKDLERNILSIASATKPEHKDKFHLVLYEDLATKPEQVIKGIYEFLGIPEFEHQFDNFKWEVMPNEANVFGIPDLHRVKPHLQPSDTDISILSDYVREKYGNALDFLFDNWLDNLR